ncbi:MAG: rRNA biogenesis protein rrp36 [Pycnora praestabilis]|nr:MAG: rRNA biogenesis protein rrp36 [Pycnora praestabilis]
MAPRSIGDGLQRRVRPRQEVSREEEEYEESSEDGTSSSVEDAVDDGHSGEDEESEIISEPHSSEHAIGSISFGALAKAQESLGKRQSRNPEDASSGTDKLQTLRERLHGLKRSKDGDDGYSTKGALTRSGNTGDITTGRSNKHAPTEMSSRKAVSRKREVVPTTKREYRDPRFEPLSGPLDEVKMKRNYSFLEGYRDDEMKMLKDEIRKTRDEGVKEKLKRALLSMESKKKAQDSKDAQQDIIRNHRSKEKELVKQGKKPFYLKKTEQKNLALMDRYSKLKGKQLDHVIERRTKKKAAKEKRNMPSGRRGAEV